MNFKTVLWIAGVSLVVFLVVPSFIAFVKDAQNKIRGATMKNATADQ